MYLTIIAQVSFPDRCLKLSPITMFLGETSVVCLIHDYKTAHIVSFLGLGFIFSRLIAYISALSVMSGHYHQCYFIFLALPGLTSKIE